MQLDLETIILQRALEGRGSSGATGLSFTLTEDESQYISGTIAMYGFDHP